MGFKINIPAAPLVFVTAVTPIQSSTGFDSRSWPFHLILILSPSPSKMNTDDSAGEGQLVINSVRSVTFSVQLPQVTCLTAWSRRLAAEANYSLVALDTNMAWLDREVLIDRPWNVVATLPAVQVAPDFDSIAWVHHSKKAHCWMMNRPPPRPVLRPKITNKVLEELKVSKQVL